MHRSFSLVLLALHLLVIYRLRQVSRERPLTQIAFLMAVLVVAEIATGVIMAYFSVPAAAQPIHLFLAIVIVGLQFVSWLVLNPEWSLPSRFTQDAKWIGL